MKGGGKTLEMILLPQKQPTMDNWGGAFLPVLVTQRIYNSKGLKMEVKNLFECLSGMQLVILFYFIVTHPGVGFPVRTAEQMF